jgi:hypothetical protein
VRSTSLFAIGIALALSGCGTATQVGFSDPTARAAALEKFHSGTAGMTCGTGFDCTLKWILAAPAAQRMAQAQKWDDLADVILAAGMDVDAAWFYLGLAAQGEDRDSVARVYYNTALRKTMTGGSSACATISDEFCAGITLPDDATKMMAELGSGGPRYAAPRRRAATPVAAAAAPASTAPASTAPASTGWVAPSSVKSASATSSFVAPAPAASASRGSSSATSGSSGGWVTPAAAKP